MLEELQALAESLAVRLRRSVAIDDPELRLLVHTPHRGETVDRHRVDSIMQRSVGADLAEWMLNQGIADATGPVRLPANEDMGVVARICVPVRCEGALLAYVWLLDAEGTATEADLDQAAETANAVGEVLFRKRLLGDLRRGRERELLRDLMASDAVVREHAAQELVASDRLPDGARIAVLALQVEAKERRDTETAIDLALQRATRRVTPHRAISTTRGGSSGVLLVAGRRQLQPGRLAAIAKDLHADLTVVLAGRATVRVGIGPVVSSLMRMPESHRCAHDALRVAAHVPGIAAVVAWDSLGIYRLLVKLPSEQLSHDAVPAGLLHLLQADDSGVLVETLEVYLDEAGRVPAITERLNIHRSSLYHRLNRIEKATGMSLVRGSDRLELHLGMKLVRLIGLRPDCQ